METIQWMALIEIEREREIEIVREKKREIREREGERGSRMLMFETADNSDSIP